MPGLEVIMKPLQDVLKLGDLPVMDELGKTVKSIWRFLFKHQLELSSDRGLRFFICGWTRVDTVLATFCMHACLRMKS